MSENLFLQIMALLIGNISLQRCYNESFTMNSHFPLKIQNFSSANALPYTAYIHSI